VTLRYRHHSWMKRRHRLCGWGLYLRSAQTRQLAVPRTRTKYGECSFAVQGRRVWCSLHVELRAPDISQASELCDVIGHMTIRFAMGRFLLVFLCNRAFVSSIFKILGRSVLESRPLLFRVTMIFFFVFILFHYLAEYYHTGSCHAIHCYWQREKCVHTQTRCGLIMLSELSAVCVSCQLVVTSDQLSSVWQPLTQLHLSLSEHTSDRLVHVELDQTELKKLITSLEAADRVYWFNL